jgi:hypothetical protein
MACIVIDLYRAPPPPIGPYLAALGLRYREAEPQPIADQIMLKDVDPASIPDELPDWMRVVD